MSQAQRDASIRASLREMPISASMRASIAASWRRVRTTSMRQHRARQPCRAARASQAGSGRRAGCVIRRRCVALLSMFIEMNNSIGRVTQHLRALAAAAPPGTRLPSVRELMRDLRVSPVTVRQALARLQREGVLEARPGQGTFAAVPAEPVAPPADMGWQSMALGPGRVVTDGLASLSAMAPARAHPLNLGYLPEELQATALLATAAARALRRPGVWGRMPIEGMDGLRAWFAEASDGAYAAHEVTICPGTQAANAAAFRALAAAGDPVLLESPTYGGAIAAAQMAGLRVIPVPTDRDGVRPDLLAEAFRRSGARLFYCQPTGANPTGSVLAPARRAEVLAVVARAGAFLIEDDWAHDFHFDGTPPPSLALGHKRRARGVCALADQMRGTGLADRRHLRPRRGAGAAAGGAAGGRFLRPRDHAGNRPATGHRPRLAAPFAQLARRPAAAAGFAGACRTRPARRGQPAGRSGGRAQFMGSPAARRVGPAGDGGGGAAGRAGQRRPPMVPRRAAGRLSAPELHRGAAGVGGRSHGRIGDHHCHCRGRPRGWPRAAITAPCRHPPGAARAAGRGDRGQAGDQPARRISRVAFHVPAISAGVMVCVAGSG